MNAPIARTARKNEIVMLANGESFTVAKVTRDGDVYGIADGQLFGPYSTAEYRVRAAV